MRVTLFLGLSVDGFIARPDDSLDFLGGAPDPSEEPPPDHGFQAFLDTVDVLVMGRRTFEVVLGFGADAWPYGSTPVVVLSRTWTSPPPGSPATVSVRSGTPREVLAGLEAEGMDHAYVDGGETARGFLAAGLVDCLVLTQVPVLIGQGKSLFGPLPGDVRLRVAESRVVGGAVQTRWEVVP